MLSLLSAVHLGCRASQPRFACRRPGNYNNGGSLIRSDSGSSEHDIGTQLDVVLSYQIERGIDAAVSFSTLIPGAFIEDTGASETIHFASAELRFWS